MKKVKLNLSILEFKTFKQVITAIQDVDVYEKHTLAVLLISEFYERNVANFVLVSKLRYIVSLRPSEAYAFCEVLSEFVDKLDEISYEHYFVLKFLTDVDKQMKNMNIIGIQVNNEDDVDLVELLMPTSMKISSR